MRFFHDYYRFIHVCHHGKQQVRLLKLQVMALQLVFAVKASNKSALYPNVGRDPELVDTSHFVAGIVELISSKPMCVGAFSNFSPLR